MMNHYTQPKVFGQTAVWVPEIPIIVILAEKMYLRAGRKSTGVLELSGSDIWGLAMFKPIPNTRINIAVSFLIMLCRSHFSLCLPI